MRLRRSTVFVLFLLTVLPFSCRSRPARVPVQMTPAPVSCRLKWLHQSQFAGMYVAQTKGWFEQAGIQCTLRPGGHHANAVQLVSSGSDQFGISSADQVIIARSRGVPVVAVAVVFQESPVCFFARKGAGITRPQDFSGRKVGMQYGTNVRTEYVAMMRHAGVDLKTVKEVPAGYNLQQFLAGRVDVWCGYTINEPLVAQEKGVPVDLVLPRGYGVNMYADCVITTDRMVAEKPELVRRFVEVLLRGWAHALNHRDEAIQSVLAQDPHLSKPHERRMLDACAELIVARGAAGTGLGSMDESVWSAMIAELRSQGSLGPKPIRPRDVFTSGFLPRTPIRVGQGDTR